MARTKRLAVCKTSKVRFGAILAPEGDHLCGSVAVGLNRSVQTGQLFESVLGW
jgi:hypothetical protein